MKNLKQSLIATAGAVILAGAVGLIISPSIRAQVSDKFKAATAVFVVNTAADPVPVAGTVSIANTPDVNVNRPDTALAFQALDVSFAALEGLGDIDVGSYDQIRVVVQNKDFPVDLVVNVIEGGQVVGMLGVIEVPGCPDGGTCVGTPPSITQVYDVPGRTLRFSTLADPRAKGNVHIFGR